MAKFGIVAKIAGSCEFGQQQQQKTLGWEGIEPRENFAENLRSCSKLFWNFLFFFYYFLQNLMKFSFSNEKIPKSKIKFRRSEKSRESYRDQEHQPPNLLIWCPPDCFCQKFTGSFSQISHFPNLPHFQFRYLEFSISTMLFLTHCKPWK